MALKEIKIFGEPILRLKAAEVREFGEHWLPFIEDMFETCIQNDGAGLAAPQVGESIRMAVVYLPRENEDPLSLVVFNPVILESEGEEAYEEGCLSLPALREEVVRPQKIKLQYQDYFGRSQELEADGILARVLQHEIDHLHGVLFIDHLSPVKKALLNGKLKKIAAGEIPQE